MATGHRTGLCGRGTCGAGLPLLGHRRAASRTCRGRFFANLTPLFAAIFSAAFWGELPHLYHVAAFALIVGGIVVTARQ